MTKPKAKPRKRTKTTKKRTVGGRPARTLTRKKTFARQTLDKKTREIKATTRLAIRLVRQSNLTPQMKKKRIAVINRENANAIKYYRSKIARIQSTGLGLIKGLRASRGMDPHIKKFHIKEVQDNMKHHIAESVQLFGPD